MRPQREIYAMFVFKAMTVFKCVSRQVIFTFFLISAIKDQFCGMSENSAKVLSTRNLFFLRKTQNMKYWKFCLWFTRCMIPADAKIKAITFPTTYPIVRLGLKMKTNKRNIFVIT